MLAKFSIYTCYSQLEGVQNFRKWNLWVGKRTNVTSPLYVLFIFLVSIQKDIETEDDFGKCGMNTSSRNRHYCLYRIEEKDLFEIR
jgi:hypothetical protein